MGVIATILSTFVFIICLPFAICLYVIFWSISYFFYLLAKLKFNDKIFRPTSLDVLASMGSDLSKPYYNVVYSVEGQNPDITQIRQHYQQRLIDNKDEKHKGVAKKWTSILIKYCGYHIWKQCSNFDIKNHIRMVDLEYVLAGSASQFSKVPIMNGGNCQEKCSTVDEKITNNSWEYIVQRFVTLYGANDIKGGIPKWELLVLKEAEERYTCLFRVHHSISDGMHFARMMTELIADKQIEKLNVPSKSQPSILSQIVLALRSFSLLPFGLWASAVYKDRNPLHGPKLSGRKNFHVSKPFELERLREIRKKVGVTVNDVIVSCVSKALTCHLHNKSEKVPTVTSLLPISQRREEENLKMKNNILLTSVQLPTLSLDIKENLPAESTSILRQFCDSKHKDLDKLTSLLRLAIVRENLNLAKQNPTIMSICWFLMTVSSLLPSFLAEAILFMDGLTLNISNICGPPGNNWTVHGAAVKNFMFLLNDKDPLGIAVSALSYQGAFRVGLIVDDALMTKQEGHDFLENLVEEVDILEDELRTLEVLKKTECREFSARIAKDIP